MLKKAQKIVIFGANGAIGCALSNHYASMGAEVLAVTREKHNFDHPNISNILINYDDAHDFEALFAVRPPDIIVTCIGALCVGETMPEKSLNDIDEEYMHALYRVNTIMPALIMKHVLGRVPRDHKFVCASLSARVGSISDNRLGGWYSYRASKAALNMIIKTASIETARKNKNAVIVGLHPGTVDSNLSKPFQKNVPDERLFTAEQSAQYLAKVINELTPEQSGQVFDWKGDVIDR